MKNIKINTFFRVIFLSLITLILMTSCAQMDQLRKINWAQEEMIKQLQQNNEEFKQAYYDEKTARSKEKEQYTLNLKTLQSEINSLKQSKTTKEKDLDLINKNLALKVDTYTTEKDQLNQTLDMTKQELTATLTKATQEAEDFKKQIEDLNKEITLLKQDISTKDTQITLYTNEIIKNKEDIEKLNTAIAQKETEFAALQKLFDKKEEEARNQEKQIGDLQDSMKNQLSETTMSLNRIDELNSKIETIRSSASPYREEYNDIYKMLSQSLKIYLDTNNLSLSKGERGVVVVINANLLFETTSTVVKPTSKDFLEHVGIALNKYSKVKVMIEGHTDNEPVEKMPFFDNWALSSQRATNVLRFMVDNKFITANRVKSVACGEFYPIKDNKTAENRNKNRRVEIVISF